MSEYDTTVRELVLARADDPAPGLRWRDVELSWAEHTAGAARRARWLLDRDLGDPGHVGVLLDNTPEFSQLLAGGALAGVPLVGLNRTRTGAALERDIDHTECSLVVTDAANRDLLEGLDTPPVVDVDADGWEGALAPHAAEDPGVDVDPDDVFMLILTSGTTSAPKAVVCSQGKISAQGSLLAGMVGLDADDVCYCAMPLFHSNAVIAGWTPGLAVGATLALRDRFSASEFLDDVRRFGATYANYVGKPLSYVLAQPGRDDDADNPLRLVFGNEAAPADVDRFAERFDCRVIEAYGSTEGGIHVTRTDDTPAGALGVPIGDVAIVDPATGEECPPAEFDPDGRLTNAEEAVGEMVNREGRGSFEGYWANEEAESDRLRNGWFWSGDLAFRDEDGFYYFAGRSGDWLRVDGENFAAAPVERVLARHPAVVEAAVEGVPDPEAGDEVMAALTVPAGEPDAGELAAWIDAQEDLGPKWVPTYLRLAAELPTTGTNKLDRRRLSSQAWACDDTVLVRDGDTYRPMTSGDRRRLLDRLDEHGRAHLAPAPART